MLLPGEFASGEGERGLNHLHSHSPAFQLGEDRPQLPGGQKWNYISQELSLAPEVEPGQMLTKKATRMFCAILEKSRVRILDKQRRKSRKPRAKWKEHLLWELGS